MNDTESAYARRAAAELEVYKGCANVHDLPAIFHYWSHKYLKPKFDVLGVRGTNELFEDHLMESARRTGVAAPRFVSVGAGNCDVEISISLALRERGLKDFTIECLELNPDMLERGRQLAKDKGVSDNLVFTQTDFNRWEPDRRYSGVMANQSLHHVLELEHLFDSISRAMLPEGLFVVSDMIGRNGHQRWPEAAAIVRQFWDEMPPRYRHNLLLQRHEESFEDWDCAGESFEGIRAQDVLPQLIERFAFELFLPFGNVIDVFIDRSFGHHFSPSGEWDTHFIDRVHARDELGLRTGELTPTHMMAVMGLQSPAQRLYLDGVTPERCVRQP